MAQRTVTIGSAVGLHARPASLFVRAATATGLHVTIARDGADAADPVDADSILAVMGLGARHGERVVLQRRRRRRGRRPGPPRRAAVARPGPRRVSPAPSRRQHYGIGVSPGAAVGPVVRMRPRVRPPPDEPAAADPAAAGQRVREALAAVAGTLELQAQQADATVREILEATAMMARDPGLAAAVDDHLASGCGPATALDAAVEDYCAAFATAGGYVAERVTDLRDVGDRAIAVLLGLDEPGLPGPAEPCVLVGHDLAPAETAALDPGRILAIITEAGGALSHTAVLAAQLGIPAVVQLAAAPTLADGTLVAVDGGTGLVVVDPDPAYRAELTERAERRAKALASSSGPGRTRDGVAVALWSTSARCRTRSPRPPPTSRAWACSGPSCSSSAPTARPAWTGRPRPTARCSSRSATAAWSSGPWTPVPTSRWRSPTSAPRATPPSADAGCACRPCARTCSTPSSRRWAGPPGPPAPTSASWHPWWPPPRRPRGSPAGSGRTACPRSG